MTQAQGGTVSYANGKKIHTFNSSGTFVITEAGTVEALVVAGGGGGFKGGGGGGGVIYTPALTVGLGNVSVTIGEGGAPGLTGADTGGASIITDGNIFFTTQTAIGGGKGGGNGGTGKNGGSGGGGGSDGGYGGGTGTVGQGNDGGLGGVFAGGGGGGGAGGVGGDRDEPFGDNGGGDGGIGLTYSISGVSRGYGGGGGGVSEFGGRSPSGSDGGGNGGNTNGAIPSNGTANTGGGGGGGGGTTIGYGGSGVVIFSYDSDFTTGRRVAQNEDLADMTASTIKGRITSTGIPQDLTAAQVAGILDTEITERAQDAVGAMVADTATIDLTYTDATPELKADVKVDSINDTHIDWGTGTNQVNLDDVPDGSTYAKITAADLTDLTDAGDSALHYHATDRDRANHTGTQLAATISNFAAGVRSTPLTGLSLATVAVIAATDNVLGAFGKLQAQLTAHDHNGGDGAAISLTAAVTGILPAANGGTGIDNSTRTLTINTNAGTIDFSAASLTLTVPATGQALVSAVGATVVGRIPFYSSTGGVLSSEDNLFWDATNNRLGIGIATPTAPLHIISADNIHLLIGQSVSDATTKTSRIASAHYTNAEEPAALLIVASTSTANTLAFGGGSGVMNAATVINFYTAANNTTTTGTIRMAIDANGTLTGNDGGEAAADFRWESDTEPNMLFLDSSTDTLYLGGSTNGVKITKGGELTLIGTATRWNDLRVEPVVRTTGAKAPTFTAYKTNVYLYDFDNAVLASEKEIFFTVQLPHDWKEGSTIYPHVHWVNRTTGTAGHVVKWAMDYTKAKIGATFGATSNISGTAIVGGGDITVADEHMVTSLTAITMTGDTISTVLICRAYRNSSDAADTYTGTAGLLYIDFHYEIDSIGGSADEFTK